MFTSAILVLPFSIIAVWLLRTGGDASGSAAKKSIWNAALCGVAVVIASLLALVVWFGSIGGESVDPSQRAVIRADHPVVSPALAILVAIAGLLLPIVAVVRLRKRLPG